MNITRYFSDVKLWVSDELNKTNALLWLVEVTLLIDIFT